MCPQQNVIFPELSPRSHLVLYGELKGLRGAVLGAAIAAILPRVGLAERALVKASASLSHLVSPDLRLISPHDLPP